MSAAESSSSSSSAHSSPSHSPEAPRKTTKSPKSSPETSKKTTKSPKSSPETPRKTTKSPKSSPETSKKTTKSPKSSPAPPRRLLKPPLVPPEAPKSPSEPKGPSKKLPDNKLFTSSLQVFLQQKQEQELVKNIEFKNKLEKGELDEDEEVQENGREGRRGSEEDGRTDKEEEERAKKGGIKQVLEKQRGPTKEGEVSDAKKAKEKKGKAEDKKEMKEVVEKDRKVKRENEKEQSKQKEKKGGGKTKGTEEERKSEEKKGKVTEKEEDKSKKVTKKGAEKSVEMVTQTKREERREEKTHDESEEQETNGKVKKEDKEDEGRKEEAQLEEGKRKEAEESSARKEEKNTKTGEEEEEEEKEKKKSTMKKEGIKDERVQGPLHLKRKRAFNRWKEYYFVLDGLLLTYYRSQHDYERLASMKGSLDLSLVEEVNPKKAGIMRTHHPFCLSRRNLPLINLAADTKEEQERWMGVLSKMVMPRRLSCHSSDKTLTTSTTPASCGNKSATLPARVKKVSCSSSSVSDDEEEMKEEKKEEEEEEQEEESDLIKPKKIVRVPIGMPLMKVNLDQVKLKKVEKKEAESEGGDEGKVASASPSPASPRGGHRLEERDPSPTETFGVMLKKTKTTDEAKDKESPREAGGARDGSASPGHSGGSGRRPSKQPVIPLNSRKLLIVPEVKDAKSPKVSPVTQKRTTVDRRKSPSPSLPISKSVQALTKSAEEVRATQVDGAAACDATTSAEAKGKDGDIKVCHAHTSEVKYNDVVEILDLKEMTENGVKAEVREVTERGVEEKSGRQGVVGVDGGKEEIQEEKETKEEEEEEVMKEDEGRKKKEEEDVEKVPLSTPLKVTEDQKEDKDVNKAVLPAAREQTRDEETFAEDPVASSSTQQAEAATQEHKQAESSALQDNIRGFVASPPHALASVTTPLTPPSSPASSVSSADSKTAPKALPPSPPSCSPVPQPPEASPPSPKHTPPSPGSPGTRGSRRGAEEEVPSSTQAHKGKTEEEEEEEEEEKEKEREKEKEEGENEKEKEVEVVPSDAVRGCTSTNESSASSCPEAGEKKSGKFKLLKNKLKVGTSTKEKKEDPAAQREPKEKKRRGSNALSVLLHGKKTKEGSKKQAEEEPQTPQVEDTTSSPAAPHHEAAASSESLPIEAEASAPQVVPLVDVQVTPPSVPCQEEPQSQLDALLATLESAEDGRVPLRTTETHGGARDSIYSYTSTSSRDEPPPCIPEKTHMRAKSPNHDVPQNNKPVTNIHLMGEEEDEDEANLKVDGYMTEEQIEALLIAKENREKKKRSLSRSQQFGKPDTVKGSPLATDEWATKRPSYNSFSSIDSDEPLLTTNFLSFERQSSSSGSTRGPAKADASERSSSSHSESGDSVSPEVEVYAEPLRRASRPTDGIAAKNRVSLTSPEYTVKEEEPLSSPETRKARPTQGDREEDQEQHGVGEDEAETEAEHKDFFPVVGGDVHLRHLAPLDLPTGDLRTSGIVSLKEYLETQEEGDLQDVKSGISRLGHSAAVEKLKQATSEQ